MRLAAVCPCGTHVVENVGAGAVTCRPARVGVRAAWMARGRQV